MRPAGLLRRVAVAVMLFASAGEGRASDLTFEGAEGTVLTIRAGKTVARTSSGFVVGLPDDGQRRHPLAIAVEIVGEPLPAGLSRCSIWRAWPRCARSREEAGGSSGEALTLTVFQPLGEKYVRYRQTRHADGIEPRFEVLDWLAAGDLGVSRAR